MENEFYKAIIYLEMLTSIEEPKVDKRTFIVYADKESIHLVTQCDKCPLIQVAKSNFHENIYTLR